MQGQRILRAGNRVECQQLPGRATYADLPGSHLACFCSCLFARLMTALREALAPAVLKEYDLQPTACGKVVICGSALRHRCRANQSVTIALLTTRAVPETSSQPSRLLGYIDRGVTARMRFILALSALVIIYVDPSEPDRY